MQVGVGNAECAVLRGMQCLTYILRFAGCVAGTPRTCLSYMHRSHVQCDDAKDSFDTRLQDQSMRLCCTSANTSESDMISIQKLQVGIQNKVYRASSSPSIAEHSKENVVNDDGDNRHSTEKPLVDIL